MHKGKVSQKMALKQKNKTKKDIIKNTMGGQNCIIFWGRTATMVTPYIGMIKYKVQFIFRYPNSLVLHIFSSI